MGLRERKMFAGGGSVGGQKSRRHRAFIPSKLAEPGRDEHAAFGVYHVCFGVMLFVR
jgi:hypothetical protein